MVKQNNKKGGLAGKQGLFIIYFRFLHSIINDLLRRYHYVFISAINERYADDGIIWFLESCDLNVFAIRRAMWQMDNAGWLRM